MKNMPSRRFQRHGPEAGFTVIELSIVSLVLLITMSAIFGVLNSMLKQDQIQRAKVNNQEAVRFTMLALSREIRGANPIQPLDDVGEYSDKIRVALGATDSTQTYVQWYLDGTDLKREVLSGANGTVTASRVMLTNVRNESTGTPLFTYYDENNAELETSGLTPVTVGDIENCTIRVRISITADSDPGPAPFAETSDAEVRNRLPGGMGCEATTP